MASVSTAAFSFMLVVITVTAYPMRKKERTDNDLIKAIRYLWNGEIRRDQLTEVIDLWNEEKDQNSVYAIDSEDKGKEKEDDKDGDEDGKGDKIETINYFWNEEVEEEKVKDDDGKGDRVGKQLDDNKDEDGDAEVEDEIKNGEINGCLEKRCSSPRDCCPTSPICSSYSAPFIRKGLCVNLNT